MQDTECERSYKSMRSRLRLRAGHHALHVWKALHFSKTSLQSQNYCRRRGEGCDRLLTPTCVNLCELHLSMGLSIILLICAKSCCRMC